MRFASVARVLLACSLSLMVGSSADAAGPDPAQYEQVVGQAIQFLGEQQAEDGSFSGHFGTGVTSLATAGLLQHGRPAQDSVVARSLAYLESHVKPDGGIYQEGTRYRNYETCLAIMCFSQANTDGKYDKLLADAEKFVKQLQWDAGEGHGPESMNYGGAGYGKHGRPDLSNTGFLIEALQATGNGEDDPAMQAALAFVSRTQNLETEHNSSPFAAAVGDGGFYYTPAAGGQSQAGETENGGLRSYGSMTYVGLKSMIYAGVGPDDPRVKAAYDWARQHYSLEQNPGMGTAGLYYYLHTFAKALAAIGDPIVVDANGVSHDWRAELVDELASTQNADGSWVNENERWLESDPNLVVGYSLLALSYCKPAAEPAE
ncbi:MAG: hypothetical protein AAGF31_04885 [Planctomycetota bacterium]